jgi:hypothetical protein
MIILIALALLASMVDVRYTLLLILAGYGDEVNPIMRWAVGANPFTAYSLAAIQTLVAGAFGRILIGAIRWRYAPACGWALLWILVAVRVGSAIWNGLLWERS